MKAMILSAGYGTRLMPYTENLPKALVPYRSVPMINYQIERLKKVRVDEIIINAHHLSEDVVNYFCKNDFGIKCTVIVEKEILGTGGGILNAEYFFKNEDYFLVMNVDIDTDIDLQRMIISHMSVDPFATLAVQDRETSRPLKFDSEMNLVGRGHLNYNEKNLYAFNGIHIISAGIFSLGYKIKFEDIINIYLDVIKNKKGFISGYDVGKNYFKDLGKLKNLLS